MNAEDTATSPAPATAGVRHPDWARHATIYEVNLRQYTPEGSFAAFAAHLPRLAAMGVDILWLMPIQPIGRVHRKGTLGSGYSISDHRAVNPDFGSFDDFRRLVDAAHALGMRVILDWVANHTAWDHGWVRAHPEWYLKDAQGRIHSYVYDNGHALEHWTDVVGLDHRQPGMQRAMLDAMKFWVTEADVDGYRCDVAALVPLAFWERARAELEEIRPVFLLAEATGPQYHAAAFDMTYDWALLDVLKEAAVGRADADDLGAYLDKAARKFPRDAYRMTFTSNHDKNAWEGHDGEVFGPAFEVCAVLAATLPGMPLVYSGQEAGLDRRLAFFEKDTIDWQDGPRAALYARLLPLKHRRQALWNGADGAPVERLPTGDASVFAFRRVGPVDTVSVVVNLSAQPRRLDEALVATLPGVGITLGPWAWYICT